ncbi:hypothetical protein FNF28_03291 [Cafeteria roenbergensis]|uniref:Serine aminopeptidase S33 domain-containing protein n=1 Tax=Cafeteria roenbergensis TaxID=33653 RepID=A0A5A8DL95_CAFRO|nr:hypothetical protein FNF28_03291 [Cafeteria roenbergensis]
MADAKRVTLEEGPAVGRPSPNERRALGALADAPVLTAAHSIGFTLSLGDEHNGRAATIMPLTTDIDISPHRLGGSPGISSTTRFWRHATPTDRPKSIVVYCHGYGHHSRGGALFRLATELSLRGHAVVAFDCEGNGCSSGLPGFIVNFQRLAVQAHVALEFARLQLGREGAETPAFLLGESMGGALATTAARLNPELFAGMILFAPMCGIDPSIIPAAPIVALAKCVASCWPSLPLIAVQDHLPACFRLDNETVAAGARADPLRYDGKQRVGTGMRLLDVMQHMHESAPSLSMPLLVFHGTADRVTDPSLSLQFWEQFGATDKTYIRLKDAWHVLMFEPYATRVFVIEALDEWLCQRVELAEEEKAAAAAGSAASKTTSAAGALVGGARVLEAVDAGDVVPLPPDTVPRPGRQSVGGLWWSVDPRAVDGAAPAEATSAAAASAAESAAPRASGGAPDYGSVRLSLVEGPLLPAAWASAPTARKWTVPS